MYKNQWMKKRRLEQVNDNLTPDNCNSEPITESEHDVKPSFIVVSSDHQQLVKHETLGNRPTIELVHPIEIKRVKLLALIYLYLFFRDPNLLVETISFASVGKLQPFLISLHTAALITIDVHCSLTRSEVVGYLAGIFRFNSLHLYYKSV